MAQKWPHFLTAGNATDKQPCFSDFRQKNSRIPLWHFAPSRAADDSLLLDCYYYGTTTTFARSEQGVGPPVSREKWPAAIGSARIARRQRGLVAGINWSSERRACLCCAASGTTSSAALSLVSRPNWVFKSKSSWSWLLRLVDRQIEMMRMSCWQWLTALWAALAAVDGHLDLFMNETETKRLLGTWWIWYVTLRNITISPDVYGLCSRRVVRHETRITRSPHSIVPYGI